MSVRERVLDSSGLGQDPVADSCTGFIETSVYLNDWDFHDELNDYHLLKEGFVP